MGKLGLNFMALVTLVLVVVFAWRNKRRSTWMRSGRCYACGAVPGTIDKTGRICSSCAQERRIQRWMLASFALIGLISAALWWWLQHH